MTSADLLSLKNRLPKGHFLALFTMMSDKTMLTHHAGDRGAYPGYISPLFIPKHIRRKVWAPANRMTVLLPEAPKAAKVSAEVRQKSREVVRFFRLVHEQTIRDRQREEQVTDRAAQSERTQRTAARRGAQAATTSVTTPKPPTGMSFQDAIRNLDQHNWHLRTNVVGDRLYHRCMRRYLSGLMKVQQTGVPFKTAAGQEYIAHPVMPGMCLDAPEQARATTCLQTWCPICITPPTNRGDADPLTTDEDAPARLYHHPIVPFADDDDPLGADPMDLDDYPFLDPALGAQNHEDTRQARFLKELEDLGAYRRSDDPLDEEEEEAEAALAAEHNPDAEDEAEQLVGDPMFALPDEHGKTPDSRMWEMFEDGFFGEALVRHNRDNGFLVRHIRDYQERRKRMKEQIGKRTDKPTVVSEASSSWGLRNVPEPFWEELWLTNIFRGMFPDILHQILKGLVKDHTLQWCNNNKFKEYLDPKGISSLDHLFSLVPPHRYSRTFSKTPVSRLSQTTGREHRIIAALLPALTAHVGGNATANQLRESIIAVSRIHLYATYPKHTTATLQEFQLLIDDYHNAKMAWKDIGVRQDFNVPKIHGTHHYVSAIRLFGTLDNFDLDVFERRHIDDIKQAFRAGNRKDFAISATRYLFRKYTLINFLKALVRGKHLEVQLADLILSQPLDIIETGKDQDKDEDPDDGGDDNEGDDDDDEDDEPSIEDVPVILVNPIVSAMKPSILVKRRRSKRQPDLVATSNVPDVGRRAGVTVEDEASDEVKTDAGDEGESESDEDNRPAVADEEESESDGDNRPALADIQEPETVHGVVRAPCSLPILWTLQSL